MEVLHPQLVVLRTLVLFLRDIYKQNYEKGNWYMDPETEMYIREEYPDNVEKTGLKPGVVLDGMGAIQRATPFLGLVGYKSIPNSWIGQRRMNQEVFRGNLILKCFSPEEEEAAQLGFLTMHSINEYADYIMGKHGIIHIDSSQTKKAEPYDVSSAYKQWASDVVVEFVIASDYHRHSINSPVLKELDIVTEFDAEYTGSEVGIYTSQFTDNQAEEGGVGLEINQSVSGDTDFGSGEVGVFAKHKARKSESGVSNPGIFIEHAYQEGGTLETSIELAPSTFYGSFSHIIDIEIVEKEIRDFTVEDSKIFSFDFFKEGVLDSIRVEGESKDFDVRIYNSNDFVEYLSRNNREKVYDILDLVYNDDEGKIYVEIINRGKEKFDNLKIKGVMING